MVAGGAERRSPPTRAESVQFLHGVEADADQRRFDRCRGRESAFAQPAAERLFMEPSVVAGRAATAGLGGLDLGDVYPAPHSTAAAAA
jgi:hypothetical protein